MLRSKLTFDQLVGNGIQYGVDLSTVRIISFNYPSLCSALCSNHVMRCGRHFAVFTMTGDGSIGVVRPVKIDESVFDIGGLDSFSPAFSRFWSYLSGKQTEQWSDSNVHCCSVGSGGWSYWFDWTSDQLARRVDGVQRNAPMGLLLDLDEGTLSLYQNGRRPVPLKDGLSGAYCWYASVWNSDESLTIKRDLTLEGPTGPPIPPSLIQ